MKLNKNNHHKRKLNLRKRQEKMRRKGDEKNSIMTPSKETRQKVRQRHQRGPREGCQQNKTSRARTRSKQAETRTGRSPTVWPSCNRTRIRKLGEYLQRTSRRDKENQVAPEPRPKEEKEREWLEKLEETVDKLKKEETARNEARKTNEDKRL